MTTGTMTYTGYLYTYNCHCGIYFALPASLYDEYIRLRGRKRIYCPLGHSMIPGDDPIGELQAKLARERADHDQTRASLRATKGVVTRTKRRIAHGVCPCCKRTFANVARHMAGQHPNYGTEGR